jgi:endonuclease/exonuclease/phosphatase (EEP) superfamily protein YafD
MAKDEPIPTSDQQQASNAWGRTLAIGSLALVGGVAAIYATRPDAFAAMTVCPAWVWTLPGLVGTWLLLRRRNGGWLARIAILAWAVGFVALADTPSAILRSATRKLTGPIPAATPDEQQVRVVTLNCGGFGQRSAQDVVGLEPQIVLLQESPPKPAVAALARELFGERGGYLHGVDASIVADGVVTPSRTHDSRYSHASSARVELASGAVIEVISLRLEPAIVRLDFWSPSCWRSQSQNRRVRQQQLRRVAQRFTDLPRNVPLILGGDFNAPAGDAIFSELKPRLKDSFRDAGVGWGNSIINEFPFARIDQIWIDDHWRALTVRAQRTLRSDHRMVIADLALKAGK